MNTPIQVPFNDLSRWDPFDKEQVSRVITEVVDSGAYLGGRYTYEFSSRLSSYLGGTFVVPVSNGTDALYLSLVGLGVGPGDKVATVANAGGYATGAILRAGGSPVLVDVDLMTAQMSPNHLEDCLTLHPEITAVVVTHLFGLMADVKAISEITRQFDVRLIEDCAQSFGARNEIGPAGSFGDAATFSFYPTKNLACLGDGGAVVFREIVAADTAREVSQYGWGDRYKIQRGNGFNSRIDEIQAGILCSRMDRVDESNDRRTTIIESYRKSLRGNRRVISKDDRSFVGHLAVLVTNSRVDDVESLVRNGIGLSIHYPVLDHHQTAWSGIFSGVSLPNSEKLVRQIVSLPCFPNMTEDEVSLVSSVLQSLDD